MAATVLVRRLIRSTVHRAHEGAQSSRGRTSEAGLKTRARPSPRSLDSGAWRPPCSDRAGFLRIYLGAAAGVGKTYQMLGDARLAAEEGTDIVIGYLEPHGRVATEERARGLERAPVVHYGSGSRAETEPDVDWLIERRPSVAIIDELAHTNPPGAPRPKRYDDVDFLLAHGIDVWTTVNIQHLESLGSRIRSLTGVEVRETFPDRLLHEADEIKLVDLSPAIAARAHRARPRLRPRPRRAGAQRLLHGREPDGAARARPARARRGRGGAARQLGPGAAAERARARGDRRAPGLLRPADPRRRAPGAAQRLGALRALRRAARTAASTPRPRACWPTPRR